MSAVTSSGADSRSSGVADRRPGDPLTVVKGGSRGFTVLLLGGVVQPLVGAASSVLGFWWLALVAVGAFVVAAWAFHDLVVAPTQGAAAALFSYALVLPLVLSAAGGFPVVQVACTSLLAVAVGGATPFLQGALRARGAGASSRTGE